MLPLIRIKTKELVPGAQFGAWTVLSSERGPNGGAGTTSLRCVCGHVKRTVGRQIIKGLSQSCGCIAYSCRRAEQSPFYKGCGALPGLLWSRIVKAARVRGYSLGITIEDAWALYLTQDGKCALSGVPIAFQLEGKGPNTITASLDRIQSTRGYLPDNVQWVHKRINKMKWSLTDQEFVSWCTHVATHAKKGTK